MAALIWESASAVEGWVTKGGDGTANGLGVADRLGERVEVVERGDGGLDTALA